MRRDLIIEPLEFEFPGRRQPVFTDHLVCVVARDNPRLADGGLSLERLQEMPHAVAEFGAAGRRKRHSRVEMERLGVVDRRSWCRSPPCSRLPFAVSGTEMCAFVPPASPLPRHPRPRGRRYPPSRCRSPRPPTGTRGATPSPPSSGCAASSTTSPSPSRTPPSVELRLVMR